MSTFKPQTTFDKIFEIGILIKGFDGFLETIGGLILLFIKPEHVSRLINFLTRTELTNDHQDFIANHLVKWSNDLTKGTLIFLGLYLLSHGLAKLILVIEILRNHLWAYVGLIVLTTGFIFYQTYEIVTKSSISMILLTVFDIVIVYLTVIEYKKKKAKHRPIED